MTITPCWAGAAELKKTKDPAVAARAAAILPLKRLTIASSFSGQRGTQQGRNNNRRQTNEEAIGDHQKGEGP
jgi:hypothetical protein